MNKSVRNEGGDLRKEKFVRWCMKGQDNGLTVGIVVTTIVVLIMMGVIVYLHTASITAVIATGLAAMVVDVLYLNFCWLSMGYREEDRNKRLNRS